MYVAIDIGGTNTRIGLINNLEDKNFSKTASFKNTHDYETDYTTIIDTINRNGDNLKAIGIGIPGDISGDKMKTYDTNNIPEWENKPIVESFRKQFSCPVYLENDGVAGGLGIAYYDKQKIGDEFAYITWGTGIGGAIVAKVGNRFEARQLSWEENFKVWEAECGGRNLQRLFNKLPQDLEELEWNQVMNNFRKHTINLAEDLNIGSIVFGGGISVKQNLRVLNMNIVGLYVFTTQLGEEIGLFGALGLIKSNIYKYSWA